MCEKDMKELEKNTGRVSKILQVFYEKTVLKHVTKFTINTFNGVLLLAKLRA